MAAPGCVGPARSFGAYEGKAGATANDVLSAVETARLAVLVGSRGRSFPPYLSIVIAEAEEDASAVEGAFDSIQPPDKRSDRLRQQLDSLLSDAVSSLSDLRIAVRRRQVGLLPELAKPLDGLSDKLDAFGQAHS